MENSEANVGRFEELLRETKREGIENLIGFIRKSDFYSAPASTRFHNCHASGLLEHSLNVYECLKEKMNKSIFCEAFQGIDYDSIAIIALLHDLCKSYYYKIEYKNKKVYSDNGTKKDEAGRFDWVSYAGYSIEDKIPLGHGEKSVMMIEEFIKLKPVERYAIRWHMGFTEPKENWNTLGEAIKKYPIVLLMHEADLEATYLLEKEE